MRNRVATRAEDASSIGAVIEQFERRMAPSEAAFVRRVFSGGIEPYSDRVAQYGFTGCEQVLDAGCGFGQWSIALARQNVAVRAIDVAVDRLAFLDALAHRLGHPNIVSKRAQVWNTDDPDGSFDAIFCYGVVFLTPWRRTLAEFARLLKPGGRLYVNANGDGWYRHLASTGHNAGPGYDPRALAARALANTERYRQGLAVDEEAGLVIEPDHLRDELTKLGFRGIRQGAEGTLTITAGAPLVQPFFQGEYDGRLGVYEILATKAEPARG